MPLRIRDLPSTLQRSGKKAQKTYAKTLESAEKTYDGDEERAHRTAFAALKHTHEKVGDHWEPKPGGKKGPSDARAADPEASRKRGGTTTGGVDANASKDHLLDLAKRAGVRGRSKMSKAELAEALKRANDASTRAARGAGTKRRAKRKAEGATATRAEATKAKAKTGKAKEGKATKG